MKFGAVPLNDAVGAVLAHSVRAGDLRMRKGAVLGGEDIAALRAAGLSEVIAARLDADDVDENEAARRVATALAGQGASMSQAFTGRVNLLASGPGVAQVDAAAINALNACHEMITCATVAPLTRMGAGGMLATVKIISYGVPEVAVQQAEAAARAARDGAVGLVPVALKTAALIVTQTGAEPDMDKGVAAIRGRLEALDMALENVAVVAHEAGAIAQALRDVRSDLALVLTASATSDAHDVAPQALRAAGGVVTRFGMPVDPGNLLFLGALGAMPVIGLPGCARAPALNGADWVLERVACGLAVSSADIAGMGVGGLLKEIPQRGQPRGGPRKGA